MNRNIYWSGLQDGLLYLPNNTILSCFLYDHYKVATTNESNNFADPEVFAVSFGSSGVTWLSYTQLTKTNLHNTYTSTNKLLLDIKNKAS